MLVSLPGLWDASALSVNSGVLHLKRGEDDCHFFKECKLQILISMRLFQMAPKYFYSCGHRLRHCVTNERRKKERLNERDRKKKREGREKETNKQL